MNKTDNYLDKHRHYTNETSVVNIINDITGLSNEEIDKLRE